MALFYNNLAADALIKQDFPRAYQYLKAAADADPNLEDVWVNLGVLYRFSEHHDLSEKAYRHALHSTLVTTAITDGFDKLIFTHLNQSSPQIEKKTIFCIKLKISFGA